MRIAPGSVFPDRYGNTLSAIWLRLGLAPTSVHAGVFSAVIFASDISPRQPGLDGLGVERDRQSEATRTPRIA